VSACLAACTGYAALVLITGYNSSGVFEWVPVALTFYTLARQLPVHKVSWVAVGLFAYWLVAAGLAYGIVDGVPPAAALALVSYAAGRWFATRSWMIKELVARAAALEREQALRALEAVDEERRAMARELHDVVAHCMSVMVVQTVGARSVAASDPIAARGALRAVELAGREALVELRRIVGVLHRDGEPLSDAAAPTVAQLHTLVERAQTAGVPVELQMDGPQRDLPAGLELVIYRVVQEALTNVIKHSCDASARVRLSYEDQGLRVEVSDTGRGAPAVPGTNGTGHGLRGMRERVALYGGDLAAGPVPTGGFAVRAQIPYAPRPAAAPVALEVRPDADAGVPEERVRWRWLDPVIAALTLLVVEQRVLAANHVRAPVFLSMLVAAAIALGALGRRRHPLTFAAAVVLPVLVLIGLGPFRHTILTICLWTWALYTVAGWTSRRTALVVLGVIIGAFTAGQVLGTNHADAEQFAGVMFLMCVPWGCGIAVQSRRRMTRRLKLISAQIAEEREDRARLAVAAERSRVARELHAAIARSVAAMVVQAEAAATALDQDLGAADAIMDAIEAIGRTALADMRRILGVLRCPGESPEREPQPGIAQIHALIRRARASGQAVEMRIDGEPGTLPPGVEIGVYRILNEALTTAPAKPERPIDVSLKFRPEEIELQVRADVDDWPTSAMHECASMCDGKLTADRDPDGRYGLRARMPTALQEAFA
jgi:signal transduction histidine kinase